MRSYSFSPAAPPSLPAPASAQATRADTTDPYIWLEDLHGARARARVNAENAKTTAVLEREKVLPATLAWFDKYLSGKIDGAASR